ncbi:MAG TPA: hypothetical protein VGI13_12605 [Candidatus Acidoferrum sp.]
MTQTMMGILVLAGIAVVTSVFVAVFVMITIQRMRKRDYPRRTARKFGISPLRLR